MDILNSDWLINMLEKSSKTPRGRMLSLFDILEDWLEAPSISTASVSAQSQQQMLAPSSSPMLQRFLALEAAKAGAAMPEMLANQLYFMAIAAAQEKLQANNQKSLTCAKNAASALISAQIKKEFHIQKSSVYAIAASFLGVFIAAGSVYFHANTTNIIKNAEVALADSAKKPVLQSSTQYMLKPAAKLLAPSLISTSEAKPNLFASPEQTTALFAQIEQMRKGNCQLIEALQLPDSYKRVYFENIVLGQISTNVNDQKLVRELLQKVRCNYTPMLMANSK